MFNPIALFASAAVIIPLLIHLWNVRKGKTLKVGSIALLAESSRQPARSRRITNWPLFLLRCLLLLLLSLLLAKPSWENDKQHTAKGWVMVPHQQLGRAYQQYGSAIDSLVKAGFELHDLSPSFDKIDWDDTTSLTTRQQSTPSTWSLLKSMDAALPKNFPVYLFSSNRLNDYQGERPLVQCDLHWHQLSTENDTIKEPVHSFITTDKKIKTTRWISTATGNYYTEDSIGTAADADTTPVRITIYPGRNVADADYLKAAIKAISEYTGRGIITSMQPSPEPQQLVFWLDDADPSANILASLTPSGTLFRYDTGTATPVFAPFNNGLHALAENKDQAFYRYAAGPAAGNVRWSLSDGRPLLTSEEKDGRTIIHFKSRFNPQWTDLVWREDFVRELLPLVLPAPSTNTDLRKIDSLQAIPRKATGPIFPTTSSRFESNKDLSLIVWIVVFAVFIIERILAHHQQKQQKDG